MTTREKNEELAYIATLTDEQVCEAYNVDYRQEAIDALNEEYAYDDEDDDEDNDDDYWSDYADDMIVESAREARMWRDAV